MQIRNILSCILTGVVLMLSCNPVTFVTSSVPATPPLPPIVELSSGIEPFSQLYRIGFLGFVDSTGGPGAPIAAALSDQFMPFLLPIRRFEWLDLHKPRLGEKHETGVLPLTIRDSRNTELFSGKQSDPVTAQYLANYKKVDGFLIGSITSHKLSGTQGTVEVELRLVNSAYDHDNLEDPYRKQLQNIVVLSLFSRVRFRMNVKEGLVTLQKEDVDKFARQIQQGFVGKFDELSQDNKLQVTEVNNRTFTVNAGSREQLKPGLTGFVVRVAGTNVYKYLAKFVVIEVSDTTATCVVISPDNTLENVQNHHNVIFK